MHWMHQWTILNAFHDKRQAAEKKYPGNDVAATTKNYLGFDTFSREKSDHWAWSQSLVTDCSQLIFNIWTAIIAV